MQEEGEVGSRRCDAVVFEANVLGGFFSGGPAEAEGWVGDHCIEGGLLGRVFFAEAVPLVVEGVAMVDLELGILHTMQEHVHRADCRW